MFDKITEASLLYDFYGQLLTKKQQQVMMLYHEENLSLSEIAAEFGISRQGIHDTLKNAEKALAEYENKLGLVGEFLKSKNAFQKIDHEIDVLVVENQCNGELVNRLTTIKNIISELEEWIYGIWKFIR